MFNNLKYLIKSKACFHTTISLNYSVQSKYLISAVNVFKLKKKVLIDTAFILAG